MADKAVESAEGGENVDTEDIMIKKLLASGKYDILPKISTTSKVFREQSIRHFLLVGEGLNCQILSV